MNGIPDMPRVTLHPGEHVVTKEVTLISTLLGSCVAVCLWDPVARVSGMNHFMLVNRRYARNIPVNISDAGRYGVHSMELLINDMMREGADRKRLRAKAFGGGAVIELGCKENFLCVGDINVRFIREFLETEKIPLEAADLGGELGRVIRFRTDTWTVYRKFIVKTATENIERKELGYWRRKLEEHEKKADEVILFDSKDDTWKNKKTD